MSQVFSFNRWLLLVGKHWSENRKRYLLSLIAVAGLLIIWFVFTILVERPYPMDKSMQAGTYFTGLFLVGCLFGSMLFADMAGGPKAIHYLAVPASALEKLLTALLFGVVLFFISYTIIFYLVDIPMMKIANDLAADWWKENRSGETYTFREVANVFWVEQARGWDPLVLLLTIYFPVQSAFILGSVYFARYSFIKTAISVLVIFLLLLLFVAQVLVALLPPGGYFESITSYRILGNQEDLRIVRLPGWIDNTVVILFKYAFTPVFWVATYFRIKEKEV